MDGTIESESHPTPGHQPEPSRVGTGGNSKWLSIIDVAAKLLAAGAIVFGAFIANSFQSSLTTSNLLSQREQADSALRAAMFHDLIGPIVRSDKDSGEIPVDREQLLVELLALNFHEHFELKPMMLYVDDRLATKPVKPLDHVRRKPPRESLRSISRRVLQRQLALLTKATKGSSPEDDARLYRLELAQRTPQSPGSLPCSSADKYIRCGYFNDLISIPSPTGGYILNLTVEPPNWEDQTFTVRIGIVDEAKRVSADHDFLLTWFDYPFTDNTLLADGTRFSLVIDQVKPEENRAILKLVWFPKDYFSARERPINHRQFREKLGLSLKE